MWKCVIRCPTHGIVGLKLWDFEPSAGYLAIAVMSAKLVCPCDHTIVASPLYPEPSHN